MQDQSSTTTLESKLLLIARLNRNEQKGFGGYATSLSGLSAQDILDREYLTDEIRETLTRMHCEGRIYIQFWSGAHRWAEWSPTAPDSFFNDFRLLVADPKKEA